jgi:hypothetical protein
MVMLQDSRSRPVANNKKVTLGGEISCLMNSDDGRVIDVKNLI